MQTVFSHPGFRAIAMAPRELAGGRAVGFSLEMALEAVPQVLSKGVEDFQEECDLLLGVQGAGGGA